MGEKTGAAAGCLGDPVAGLACGSVVAGVTAVSSLVITMSAMSSVTTMAFMITVTAMGTMSSMTARVFMITVTVMGPMSSMTAMASVTAVTAMSIMPRVTSMRRMMRVGTMPTMVHLATVIAMRVGIRLLRCRHLVMEVRGRIVRVGWVWVWIREREEGRRLGGGSGGRRGLNGHHDGRHDVLHACGKARDDLLLFGRELRGGGWVLVLLRGRGPIREEVWRDVLHRSITLAEIGSTEIRPVLLSLLVVAG